MARHYNLARMSTATTGTGTITLGSAVSGFLTFAQAGVPNGGTVTYGIKEGSNSEIGRGTYTSSGTTLTRSVLKSTNSGSAITLSGSAEVFITAAAEDFRETLYTTRTYYVRTDGSDSNSGLENTAGGAFLTIQAAIDAVSSIDISIYAVTVQVGTGTYAEALTLKDPLGSATCTLLGDTGTLTNCKISPASGASITANASKRWVVSGFELNPTSNAVVASNYAILGLGANKFNASSNGVYCDSGATVNFSANFTIAGGGTTFFNVSGGGTVVCQSVTVTVSGTPAFSAGFAYCTQLGYLLTQSLTFSGSATGSRYTAATNGVINTGGGGASYFPGNSAGSTASGGQYA